MAPRGSLSQGHAFISQLEGEPCNSSGDRMPIIGAPVARQ